MEHYRDIKIDGYPAMHDVVEVWVEENEMPFQAIWADRGLGAGWESHNYEVEENRENIRYWRPVRLDHPAAEQPSPSPVEETIRTLEYYQGIIAGFADRADNDHERNVCHHDIGNLHMAIKTIGMYKSFIDQAGPSPQSVKGMRWRPGGDAPEDAALFHSAHWRRVEDKKPILPVGLNHEGNFIAQFGKVYELHQVEWLCEDEYPSDTLKVDAVAFGKWLKHLDNGTTHYDPNTFTKTDTIGYSPFDCFVDGTLTIEQLYDLYTQSLKP